MYMKKLISCICWPGTRKRKTIRDVAVSSLAPLVDEYADWNAEQGLYLPPGFEKDPTGWAQALREMQYALNVLRDECNEEGDLYDAKKRWAGQGDNEQIEDINNRVINGLTLLGKYLFYLNDKKADKQSSK
jgi:hypothetical protein